MSKRKQPKSRFVLEESDGVVVASMQDEYDISLKHTVHDMPHPRVRAPRRKKSQIEEDSKYMASIFNESQEEHLRKNINATNQEINKHIQEIRKSLKRIQALACYAVTAEKVLNEIE